MKHFGSIIASACLVVMTLLAATGCASAEQVGTEKTGEYYPGDHYVFEQEVEPGNFVTCVWAKSGYGGGVSCDWVGYHNNDSEESE